MKIHEADAKSLLVAQGLPVPPWEVARTPSQARAAAVRFLQDPANATGKVVIKAQVLVGGRGKAGGVRLAGTPDEAEDVAAQIRHTRLIVALTTRSPPDSQPHGCYLDGVTGSARANAPHLPLLHGVAAHVATLPPEFRVSHMCQ